MTLKPLKHLTHEERRQRREAIARYCKTHTRAEACKKFKASYSSVRDACREFGVDGIRSNVTVADVSTFAILKQLMDGEPQSDIARERGVSRQLVNQIAVRARQAGILS